MLTSVLLAALLSGPFHFEVQEGQNVNCFLRDGSTAAHVVLRSGHDPRILVAFPAGNSGVALWFQRQSQGAEWTVDSLPVATSAQDSRQRPLYGVKFETSIALRSLAPRQAILSSVRVLRDYESAGKVPAEVLTRAAIQGNTIEWARNRVDGAAGYQFSLEVIDGRLQPDGQISAGAAGRIKLRVTALSGEVPLTPLANLLNGHEAQDKQAQETLTFLSYKEKFLAGSWRFNTYFGRDTLMSVRLLLPVLAPEAIEAGLRSVVERLSPDGEVAHEESIGEFAALTHQGLDYNMVDENYMFTPVIAAYVLDGKKRAAGFLGPQLVRNLRLVATSAAKFAADPRYPNLISLKPGRSAGEWRDSSDGIGGGRYPYDVNAVLVPAALEATGRLLASGLLDPWLTAADRKLLGHTVAAAKVWRERAPELFDVTIDKATARAAVDSYARETGVPSTTVPATIRFHAISLDAAGKPVPIVNSDEGFALLFDKPPPAMLERDVESVMHPFPLGLMTDAGMLVANPVFADAALKSRFSNHAYHGTVVWSWQQALFAGGLERQLGRTDLPPTVKEHLRNAQQSLWQAIRATQSVSNSELWSWRFQAGHYRVAPFGASGSDVDESNAAQLWSSVYLAVKAPNSP